MGLGGMTLSIYHPDTRTMYVWWGDPRPVATRPMNCIELQLSATPNGPSQKLVLSVIARRSIVIARIKAAG